MKTIKRLCSKQAHNSIDKKKTPTGDENVYFLNTGKTHGNIDKKKTPTGDENLVITFPLTVNFPQIRRKPRQGMKTHGEIRLYSKEDDGNR